MVAALERIANALEHASPAAGTVRHENCVICIENDKRAASLASPKKFQSVRLTPEKQARREAQIREQRLTHGPEEPEHELRRPSSFRYLEREGG